VAAVRQAERDAVRVVELARAPAGIPIAGAVTLLRNDAYTQGPKLFARHCASCHRYEGHDGLGVTTTNPPSGADLKGFASREWLAGLHDPARISSPHYFGGTKFADGKMARFVKKAVAEFSAEQKEQLTRVIAAVSAEASLKSQRAIDQRDSALIAEGRVLFTTEAMRCAECHQFRKKDEDATAPDLTGYGSKEWLVGIITNPKHERYYGKRNDRMPAFGADSILDAQAMGLLADWLRGEWYEAKPSDLATAKP
jgi:ubiquinol-cytochrome c reductase cytochrome b subunit